MVLAFISALVPAAALAVDASVIPSAGQMLPILPPESLYAAGGPVAAGPVGEILDQAELRAPEGTRKWAVIYRSTGLDGAPIGVSGLVIAPAAPLPPGAPKRTVLSVAHGSAGLADVCAPSRAPSDGLVDSAQPLLEQGFVLVATDYEGLGTPGPHPYIVGRSAGRSVLDAAVAAGGMPETGAGPTTVLVGGSQGGHAVLWAADMAATEAPGLDVIGAVAFAPAGDLEAIGGVRPIAAAGPDAWSSAVALVERLEPGLRPVAGRADTGRAGSGPGPRQRVLRGHREPADRRRPAHAAGLARTPAREHTGLDPDGCPRCSSSRATRTRSCPSRAPARWWPGCAPSATPSSCG